MAVSKMKNRIVVLGIYEYVMYMEDEEYIRLVIGSEKRVRGLQHSPYLDI